MVFNNHIQYQMLDVRKEKVVKDRQRTSTVAVRPQQTPSGMVGDRAAC